MGQKVEVSGTGRDLKGGNVLIGGTAYAIKKGRTLKDGTGYDIPFSAYDPVFANNEWPAIIAACQSGNVPDTWAVGDYKNMIINGANYQVDIIGKTHDTYAAGGTAPLTFHLHDCYGTAYAMNSSATNSGGWKNSQMRTTHLPAILALMPTEVRNGIRGVSKKASVGSGSSTIETVTDTLFLLSEVEIFGANPYSVAGEGTQYDYYKAGNSAAKTRDGAVAGWWTRSPYINKSNLFCLVNGSGAVITGMIADLYNASYVESVSFGFCF